jgi:FkbM family methyltransferase
MTSNTHKETHSISLSPHLRQLTVADAKKKWLRDILNPFDRFRYLLWRASRSQMPIVVSLQDGTKLLLRPSPTTDLATAYELFIDRAYEKPMQVPEPSPGLIVDLGANVGYSVIHWAHIYPNARLVAFEPHPTHILMLYRHLELNAVLNRVQVVGSAASNCNAESFLTNDENESVVVEKYESGRLPIKVRDFFTEFGTQTIDLLKMDIEGGEYAILKDQRFETLDVRMIVLEWHNTAEISNGWQWCSERLSSLGYSLADGKLRYANAGILWAWKDT